MDADDYAQQERDKNAAAQDLNKLDQYDVFTYTSKGGEYGVLNIPANSERDAVLAAQDLMSASIRSKAYTEDDTDYKQSVLGIVQEKSRNNNLGFWERFLGWTGGSSSEDETEETPESESDRDYYNRRDN